MDKSHFKHTTEIRVRNYEVDWQGILHNAVYLQYFEVARLEYLKQLGIRIDMGSIQGESKVVLVRNEIDYMSPVRFEEIVAIYTRIASIKNSSFVMEGMMERSQRGGLVATNIAYHVWLDPRTDRPRTIGDEFRKLVQTFEGSSCEILWPMRET